jgi:hypothetical protein
MTARWSLLLWHRKVCINVRPSPDVNGHSNKNLNQVLTPINGGIPGHLVTSGQVASNEKTRASSATFRRRSAGDAVPFLSTGAGNSWWEINKFRFQQTFGRASNTCERSHFYLVEEVSFL